MAPLRLLLDSRSAMAEVVAFAAAAPWPHPQASYADDLRLLLEELLSNVLRHAFAGLAQPQASCTLHYSAACAVRIELHDNGPEFDPWHAGNPAGLGLSLIRSLAQEPRHRHGPAGNQVVLHLRA